MIGITLKRSSDRTCSNQILWTSLEFSNHEVLCNSIIHSYLFIICYIKAWLLRLANELTGFCDNVDSKLPHFALLVMKVKGLERIVCFTKQSKGAKPRPIISGLKIYFSKLSIYRLEPFSHFSPVSYFSTLSKHLSHFFRRFWAAFFFHVFSRFRFEISVVHTIELFSTESRKTKTKPMDNYVGHSMKNRRFTIHLLTVNYSLTLAAINTFPTPGGPNT